MVIAATDDTDVNIEIYEDAERRAMLVNVVDVPPLCNFILPAIIRTGPLAIAISTAGASPALAKRIRDEIADEYGEPYARLAIMLNEVRGWAKGTLPTYQDRKVFFESIVNGEPDPIELLRRGDEARRARPDRGRAADPPACLTTSHTSTRPGAPGWSTWATSRSPTGARVARAVVRMSRGDRGGGGARRRAQGRRGLYRPHRRHPGRQAHGRADPALPPAGAVVRGRRRSRCSTTGW